MVVVFEAVFKIIALVRFVLIFVAFCYTTAELLNTFAGFEVFTFYAFVKFIFLAKSSSFFLLSKSS